jgi:hypothetical protein
MKAYAGIGSRETPPAIRVAMTDIARELAEGGWTLRSGGADGADTAFAHGSRLVGPTELPQPEIYLPWRGFNDVIEIYNGLHVPQPESFEIARRFHPAWDRCSFAAQKLHARNVHQILGPDVTAPLLSRFVICWTKDGAGGGGTGQALRIAKHYEVPCFDLAIQSDFDRITGGLFA